MLTETFPVSPLDAVEEAKRLAAYTAVDRHIRPEDKVRHKHLPYVIKLRTNESSQVIGIGSGTYRSNLALCCRLILRTHTGSTVPYVVERILQQGQELNKDRVFLPTGFQSQQLITLAGLRLGDITQYSELDVTIDGADE